MVSIILEPAERGAVNAIIFLLFLPGDHFVPDENAFVLTLQAGIVVANEDFILAFKVSHASQALRIAIFGMVILLIKSLVKSMLMMLSVLKKTHSLKKNKLRFYQATFWECRYLFVCFINLT